MTKQTINMKKKILEIKGQMLFDFGAKKESPAQKITKRLKLEQIRKTKQDALALSKKIYATIMRSPQTFSGISQQHIAMYKKEFGKDIGALKKGTVSAVRA